MAQSKKPYITLNMEEDLLREIDEFRFVERFQSRAEAMRWLMRAALDHGLRRTKGKKEKP